MAFDCLYHNGLDYRAKPLRQRKDLLHTLVPAAGPLRYSEEIETGGKALLDHACRLGLEGIVSKRIDAPYRSGRGQDWLKSKCAQRDEFIIIGFTASTALKRAIGALILGAYEKGRLVPVGRAGSGGADGDQPSRRRDAGKCHNAKNADDGEANRRHSR